MAELLVEQIRPGMNVSGAFALKVKKLLPYREAPGHFLAVTLADRTGNVEGRLWEGAEETGARLKVGDIVAVEAQAIEYNGSLQLRIDSITKKEGPVDPARFILTAEGSTTGATSGSRRNGPSFWRRRYCTSWIRWTPRRTCSPEPPTAGRTKTPPGRIG